MQRNSVISLRPALGKWRTPRDVTGADPGALYGCVDWFIYQDASPGACSSRPTRGEPAKLSEPVSPAAPGLQADAAPGPSG